MLLANGLLHGDCMTITGRTIGEELAAVPAEPRADQDVIRPWSKPMYAQGHLAILQGQSRARGLRRQDHRAQESVDHRARRACSIRSRR